MGQVEVRADVCSTSRNRPAYAFRVITVTLAPSLRRSQTAVSRVLADAPILLYGSGSSRGHPRGTRNVERVAKTDERPPSPTRHVKRTGQHCGCFATIRLYWHRFAQIRRLCSAVMAVHFESTPSSGHCIIRMSYAVSQHGTPSSTAGLLDRARRPVGRAAGRPGCCSA